MDNFKTKIDNQSNKTSKSSQDKPKNLHEGHRERMKKEFLANGLDNLPEHKMLEMLLFYCVPRRDTNELAHQLIEKYKSLAGVLDAPAEELVKFSGITENGVVLLKLIIPLARAYGLGRETKDPVFKSVEDIGDYLLKRYFGFTEEAFSIVCMDSKGKLLDFKILGEGDINSVGVSTRNVIQIALNSNAVCVVLAHNHPSGIALPSNQDIAITEQIKTALSHVNVRVIDHIIIADNDYVSMYQSKKYKHIFL